MSRGRLIEAKTPSELWKQVHDIRQKEPEWQLLSAPELADLRIEVAIMAMDAAKLRNPGRHYRDGMRLTEAIINTDRSGAWSERFTTSTHFVRVPNGHQFIHNLHINPGSRRVHDGGIPYGDLKSESDFKPGKLVRDLDYRKSPGGCYPIKELINHKVFRALLDEDDLRINEYAKVLEILSYARASSRGRESIWCPQDLKMDDGRAWALGIGGDSAYPPNATTNNHWGLMRKPN